MLFVVYVMSYSTILLNVVCKLVNCGFVVLDLLGNDILCTSDVYSCEFGVARLNTCSLSLDIDQGTCMWLVEFLCYLIGCVCYRIYNYKYALCVMVLCTGLV